MVEEREGGEGGKGGEGGGKVGMVGERVGRVEGGRIHGDGGRRGSAFKIPHFAKCDTL